VHCLAPSMDCGGPTTAGMVQLPWWHHRGPWAGLDGMCTVLTMINVKVNIKKLSLANKPFVVHTCCRLVVGMGLTSRHHNRLFR